MDDQKLQLLRDELHYAEGQRVPVEEHLPTAEYWRGRVDGLRLAMEIIGVQKLSLDHSELLAM